MGIYSNFNSSSIDDGNFTPRDLFAECGETATYEELALAMVAESEQNYISIMKAIAINEVNYFAQNGEEIVYEAGGVSGIFNKIKEFFKKLIEKVRQILHAFIAKLSSFASSDSSFVQKYQKEFSEKWNKIKSDYEFSGYKFTVKTDAAPDRANIKGGAVEAVATCCDSSAEAAVKAAVGVTNLSDILGVSGDLKKILDSIRDNKDDIQEAMRGKVANIVTSSFSSGTATAADSKFTASEFSKELFEKFRDGEENKQSLELKKEFSVADIVGDVKNTDKFKKAAQKFTDAVVKGLNDEIKVLDKLEKDIVKIQTGDEIKSKSGNAKTAASNSASNVLGLVSEANGLIKDYSSYYVQANGIYLQAIADRNRQAKAIMVKVIGSTKKMTESYDEDEYEEVAESVNYFDKIVLK